MLRHGDLAGTYAWELMLNAPFPSSPFDEALHAFVRVQKHVYFGQHLDVTANRDVQRMHRLKTGAYTTRGPALWVRTLAMRTTIRFVD
ncbi:MAG: hypothetical protein R3A47_07730 [Polyangiales bacterium]